MGHSVGSYNSNFFQKTEQFWHNVWSKIVFYYLEDICKAFSTSFNISISMITYSDGFWHFIAVLNICIASITGGYAFHQTDFSFIQSVATFYTGEQLL